MSTLAGCYPHRHGESASITGPNRCTAEVDRSVPEPEMTAASFHDLIRNRQQRGRDFETERLGGLEVDRQLELGGRLRWEIGRASALQNAVDIGSRSPSDIRDVGAVSRLSSARARMEGGSPGQGPS
jgi:hypothetical protein